MESNNSLPISLSLEQMELISEALEHLHFENQRAAQGQHVDFCPNLKDNFLEISRESKKLQKLINFYIEKIKTIKFK